MRIRRRWCPLTLLPVVLLLGGCATTIDPASFLIREPMESIGPSEAPLGATVDLTGRVLNHTEGTSLPLALTWPQDVVVGAVGADGTVTATLFVPPPALLRPVERLWDSFSSSGSAGSSDVLTACPVTSLRAEPADALTAEVVVLTVPLAQPSTAVSPSTSPPPPTHRTLGAADLSASGSLVYVDRDVHIVGSIQCIEVSRSTMIKRQFDVGGNVILRRGWNRLHRRFGRDEINGVTVHRTSLQARPSALPTEWRIF